MCSLCCLLKVDISWFDILNIQKNPISDCTQSTADIVFLLDSSGSVGETNFIFLTSFIGDLISDFNVGPDVIQVGMVTFESNVTNHFNLNQYATKEEVITVTWA